LYDAEIVAEVEKRTMDVFTVKVALVAPGRNETRWKAGGPRRCCWKARQSHHLRELAR